jgi:hypothetical protein
VVEMLKSKVLFSCVLLMTLAAAMGCSIHSPGIVPPLETASYGEWVITRVGPQAGGWRLEANYVPESDEHLILSFDLVVTLDGEEVDFSFDEASQELYYSTLPGTGEGEHVLKIVPAEDAALRFPSLTVQFQLE